MFSTLRVTLTVWSALPSRRSARSEMAQGFPFAASFRSDSAALRSRSASSWAMARRNAPSKSFDFAARVFPGLKAMCSCGNPLISQGFPPSRLSAVMASKRAKSHGCPAAQCEGQGRSSVVTVAGRGNEKAPGCYLGGLVAAVVSLPDYPYFTETPKKSYFRKPYAACFCLSMSATKQAAASCSQLRQVRSVTSPYSTTRQPRISFSVQGL